MRTEASTGPHQTLPAATHTAATVARCPAVARKHLDLGYFVSLNWQLDNPIRDHSKIRWVELVIAPNKHGHWTVVKWEHSIHSNHTVSQSIRTEELRCFPRQPQERQGWCVTCKDIWPLTCQSDPMSALILHMTNLNTELMPKLYFY